MGRGCAVPAVIFEFASDDTYLEDLGAKRELYERLGVTEYFLFDPLGDCFSPRLQGFRLAGTQYQRVDEGSDESLVSEVLGLRFTAEGYMLRVHECATGRHLADFLDMPELAKHAMEVADRTRHEVEKAHHLADEERKRADDERKIAR